MMASNSRHERQEIRQRGAGTRNVDNVDFGIAFDAVPQNSRQERKLMRQRGAGTRKINNVDFGIAFPTPDLARRSKTPQTAAQSSKRPSKTPSRSIRGHSASRSIRGSSRSNRPSTAERRNVYDVPENDGEQAPPTSAKRRKLNGGTGALLNTAEEGKQSPIGGTDRRVSVSRRRRVSKPITINEDPGDPAIRTPENFAVPTQVEPTNGPDQAPQIEMNKENLEAGKEKSQQKRKKRKSIGQQSTRKKKKLSESSTVVGSAQTMTGGASRKLVPTEEIRDADVVGEGKGPSESEAELLESPPTITGSSPPIKKRKKRKSVVLGRKKRRSSGNTSLGTNEPTQLIRPDDGRNEQQVEIYQSVEDQPEAESSEQEIRLATRTTAKRRQQTMDDVEIESSEDEVRSAKRKTAQRRRASPSDVHRSSPIRRPLEADENEDDDYVDDESPEPPTPFIPKKSRKLRGDSSVLPSVKSGQRNASRSSRTKKTVPARPKKTRSTFPILTHRLTNTGALPTIFEEGEAEGDSEDDLNSANVRFPDRTAPNAVDVLAQICRETVDTAISRVAVAAGSAADRAEVKRKRTALEAFGRELDGRLFDMSAAVEDRLTLEGRVKKSKREKTDLQAQWIEVRRQREVIALKCDAVRRKHWESEADGRERHELSEQLHTLGMVMEREKDDAEDGLEFMMRNVAGHVSGAGGGGLLDRVKEFNRQLERTAAVLEGRLG